MKNGNRNYSIELMRFVMSLYIISFHMSKSLLKGKYFLHGNVAVSFFFLLTGFQLGVFFDCKKTEKLLDIGEMVLGYLFERLKKIAIPFYLIWVSTFLLSNYSEFLKPTVLLDRFLQGSAGLLFLTCTGLSTTAYTTGQWYLSAMFFSILIILPLLLKLKKTYSHIVAVVFGLLALGYIANEYDNKFGSVMTVCGPFTKGLWWALIAMNLGIFSFVICAKLRQYFEVGVLHLRRRKILCSSIEALLILIVLVYGFIVKSFWDGHLIIVIAAILCIEFGEFSIYNSLLSRFGSVCLFLGRLSVYLYLSGSFVGALFKMIFPTVESSMTKYALRILLAVSVSTAFLLFCEWLKNQNVARKRA